MLLLYLEKFLRRSRSTFRNNIVIITPLLWTGELRAARNATHNVRTRLKNFSSNIIVSTNTLYLSKEIFSQFIINQ